MRALRGSVVDVKGNPVPNIAVTISCSVAGLLGADFSGNHPLSLPARLVTDATGHYYLQLPVSPVLSTYSASAVLNGSVIGQKFIVTNAAYPVGQIFFDIATLIVPAVGAGLGVKVLDFPDIANRGTHPVDASNEPAFTVDGQPVPTIPGILIDGSPVSPMDVAPRDLYVDDTLVSGTASVGGGTSGGGTIVVPSGASFIFDQSTASSVWTVNHNLGYRPGGVSVVDSAGNEADGMVQDVDTNTLRIIFSAPFAGVAYLS